MKDIWIRLMRSYIRLGLFFYYKKINVVGKDNVPKTGAVLFVCNHQNALIDPLIIGTTNGRSTHFLTRAGVFKKKIIIKLFDSVQMIPIYRIRDGWKTLSKNEAIFNKCFTLLNNQKALLMFPEGNHSLVRKIRPLSKGFTRIIFGAIEKYPDLKIEIVPVGLNYNTFTNYPASVSVHFGKPIDANQYLNKEDIFSSTIALKEVVRNHIKKLTTHIDDPKTYDNVLSILENTHANFLDPITTNLFIETIDPNKNIPQKKTNKNSKGLLYYLVVLNSLIPWIIWKKIQKKITEKEFTSTFRFGLGITLFPIFYTIQSLVLCYFFDLKTAAFYFFFCILSGLVLTKFSKENY